MAFYYNAFAELASDRTMDGGIPWTAISQYGRRYEIEGQEFEDFAFLIRALDQEWQKIMDEKKPKT